MNPILLAALALGGGALYYAKSRSATATVPPAGMALDPGMDSYTSSVISKALTIETDPSVLDTLATDLKNAGFPNSAGAVASRSAALKANIKG